ncbi:MAG: SIS domain-containing protein [Burkholderiales bacterium]
MFEQRIQQQFFDSADLLYAAAESLSKPINEAAHAIVGCITAGGKVLACGNGSSASQAQQFAAEFMGRFERERPGLAALALHSNAAILSAFGEQAEFDAVYAKQIQALGQPGDVLLVLSASDAPANLLAAIAAARAKDMVVVILTGRVPNLLTARLAETDVAIGVPHDRPARVHEVHTLIVHCLCDAVDLQLLGEQDPT